MVWNWTIGATWPVYFGIALIKAAPLLLTLVLLIAYRQPIFASFAFDPEPSPGHRE